MRYVAPLLDLKDALKARAPVGSRFEPPWTTINTGALVGGVAQNVIPGKARVDREMRPVEHADADFAKPDHNAFCAHTLLPAMRAVSPDAGIVTEVIGEVDGLITAEANEAGEMVMDLTGASGADTVLLFGTEAGILQPLGISAVVCGPGSIEQARKPDEFVEIDQLRDGLAMLERLGAKLAA